MDDRGVAVGSLNYMTRHVTCNSQVQVFLYYKTVLLELEDILHNLDRTLWISGLITSVMNKQMSITTPPMVDLLLHPPSWDYYTLSQICLPQLV